jgi:transketolase
LIAKPAQGRASLSILAIGTTLKPVLDAAGDLPAAVYYTATPRPIDLAPHSRAIAESGALLVVEPFLEGTMAMELSPQTAPLGVRTFFLGFPRKEHRHYGTAWEHEAAHGLDAAGIRRQIESLVSRNEPCSR